MSEHTNIFRELSIAVKQAKHLESFTMSENTNIFRELSIAEQLSRVARLWRTVVDKELAPLGLTQPRWTALWKLQGLGDRVSQKTLATGLDIEVASLMRTLSQLEEQGLVVRESCPADKRARIVCLTNDGRALIDTIEVRIMKIRRDILADISTAELKQFESVIERINHNALDRLTPSSQ